MMSYTSKALVLVLFIMILCYQSCGEKNKCFGSCGDHQVSHPFRLQHYPHECGDPRYNLSCEHDNQLILYLQSGKYRVLSINYNNYTIRMTDVNVVDDDFNHSSLPWKSLVGDDDFTYSTIQKHDFGIFNFFVYDRYRYPLTKMLMMVRCEHKLELDSSDEGKYTIESAPCTKALNESSQRPNYFYWLISSQDTSLRDLGLKEGCDIELIYMTSWPQALNQSTNNNKVSCSDIHSIFLYGFELSWLQSFCPPTQHSKYGFFFNNKPRCGTDNIFNLWLLLGDIFDVYILIVVATRVLGTPMVIVFLIYKWRRRHLSMYPNIEDFLQSDNNIMPIRYSYKDIKKITQCFKVKLGKGGFGSVFKGQLRSGRLVAVKMLDKAKSDGQDFINEVATLGRIHHFNVVHLIGYCVEGTKRALLYEFMQNGSLDKYIHSQQGNDHSINCAKLYEISLGVARGIEYLHKGCNMQILHFDIKPHNILLDDHFNPKVSDFGLAKLYPTKNSIVSLTAARGTIGYMAPELFYRNVGGVSYKADVYSFGMLLMEMAGRRKNLNAMAEHSSQLYLPFWVYDRLNEGKEINIENTTEEEMKLVRKMMKVGLWCIQTKPSDRPSMNRVVEMLEGEEEDIEIPPKPYLYPQDMPAMDVGDHSSSAWPSSDPSKNDSFYKDSISLLVQEDDRSA